MKMKVNIGRIEEIVGDDIETRNMLLNLFLQTFDKVILNVENSLGDDAASKKKWDAAIHERRGAALNLGFNDLAKYCGDIEHKELRREEKTEAIKLFFIAREGVKQILEVEGSH